MHAVDNRCPHMGFPLHRGTVSDGILTCHWHHARFDLCTGGTFDQWADDLRRFPVEVDGDDVYVDVTPRRDPVAHQRKRLHDGLERDIPLVLAKAAIALARSRPERRRRVPRRARLRRRAARRGLVPRPDDARLPDEPRAAARRRRAAAALYHGLADVAADSARMEPPRFPLEPLPGGEAEPARLARWFRRFVEVRDAEGAERALVSAVRAGRVAGASSPTCSSPRPPTTATSTAATRSTSSTRRSRRSTPPAGSAPRPCSHRCPRSSPSPSGWRRRTPGATRSTWSRCSRTPSRSCPRRSPRARGGWDGARRLVEPLLARRPARDPRRAARRAARGRDRGRARLGGGVRGRDADRPLPDEQRVRRLGHRAAHVHVRERRRAGPAPLAVAGARCAASSTRR